MIEQTVEACIDAVEGDGLIGLARIPDHKPRAVHTAATPTATADLARRMGSSWVYCATKLGTAVSSETNAQPG